MKYLFLTISLLALIGCKNNKKEEVITNKEVVTQSLEVIDKQEGGGILSVYDNSWTTDIKKDNGVKWKANLETNEGVLKMQNSIKTQPTNTLVEYYQLAEKLNKDKNYVIKYCSMKGDSHENLHVWLLPLMAKINALSEVKSIKNAAKLKQSIKENINAYSDYFE